MTITLYKNDFKNEDVWNYICETIEVDPNVEQIEIYANGGYGFGG